MLIASTSDSRGARLRHPYAPAPLDAAAFAASGKYYRVHLLDQLRLHRALGVDSFVEDDLYRFGEQLRITAE